MLFLKKRGLSASGRAAVMQAQPSAAAETYEAVVETLQPEEDDVAIPQDDISQISGDPIQQLFTTLGKFHRHLNKAQNAPDNGEWCDECMNELMTGLDISIACEWTPVKDALIDAARILHSYEEVGKAGLCVPFLRDSYELLSLMVGDLIVDTVRTGVKKKWRDHYMRAVEELESHDISLVEDEEREVTLEHNSAASATETATRPDLRDERQKRDAASAPAHDAAREKENQQEAPDVPEDNASQENETVTETDKAADDAVMPETPENTAQHLAAELDDMNFDLPALSESAREDSAKNKQDTPDDDTPFPPASGEEETPFDGSLFDEKGDVGARETEDLLPFDPGNGSKDNDVQDVPVEDKQSNAASVKAQEDRASASECKEEPGDEILASVAATPPERVSDQPEKTNGGEGSQAVVNPPADRATEEEPLLKREEDEATGPEQTSQEQEGEAASQKQADDQTQKASPEQASGQANATTDAAAPSKEDAPDAPADRSAADEERGASETVTPATLLQRALDAITVGDTSNTKEIALELAVVMARSEYEQAREELGKAERTLLENGRVIKQTEAKISETEGDLSRTEELLAARDGERGACREQIGVIDDELNGMSAELADIDAQIAALQQRRREQVNRIENKQAEREEAIDSESRAQTEMEALSQETDNIRERLTEAQEEVRRHNAERRAIELTIIQAREEMEARRLSLAAIEQTRRPDATSPKTETESDSLL